MSAVVHVVVAGEVGGAERMLVDLAGAAGAAGETARPVSIALITPNERLRALFRDAALDVDDRGPSREGPLTTLVRSLGPLDVRWLTKILERRRASIVHLHTFASQVVGTRAGRAVGARVVRTEHSTRVYEDPSCWPLSRWSLRRADAAVCISEHVRRVAVAKAPWAGPILRVIPNGVDLTRFAEAPMPARGGGDGSGEGGEGGEGGDGRLRFIALGRLEPRKGIDIALRALTRVPNATLDIVGDGDSREALERLASELGLGPRVRFLGFASDVRASIAAAHVALSSARAEGLGIALLEAMAMGRPVVALPTGGVPEFVKDGGTGWLAFGSEVDALVRAMQDAVDASAEEVAMRGARARAMVVDRFSIRAMREGYERLYASLFA